LRQALLNAHKTYRSKTYRSKTYATPPLLPFSLIVFLYPNKKARISFFIILRFSYEMPPKSYDTFLFPIFLSFYA